MLTPKQLCYRLKHKFLLLIGVRKPPVSYPTIDCEVGLDQGVLMIMPQDENHPRKFACDLGFDKANGLITSVQVFDRLTDKWIVLNDKERFMKTKDLKLRINCGLLEATV